MTPPAGSRLEDLCPLVPRRLLIAAQRLADRAGRGAGARRGLARLARAGAHRRLDRNGSREQRGRPPARTSRGGCPTAAAPDRSCSAIASTCRTRPARASMEQERLMCFNADTGKLLWEHRYNMFTSDVPAHRIAWSSPVVDPATGNVFAISGNGLAMSLSKDGKLLWERSLAEEYGMWTTHGGRDVDADHRRRQDDRQRPGVRLGPDRRAARTASSRSTRPTARRSGSARPKGGRPTRSTPTRTSPTSTACACSSRAAATARCTRSRSRPASRCGTGTSASAA